MAVSKQDTRKVSILWAIKGYVVFGVRPHKEIVMSVTSETGNKYDPHAMVVTMPPLEDIPIELHTAVTREQSRGRHTHKMFRI